MNESTIWDYFVFFSLVFTSLVTEWRPRRRVYYCRSLNLTLSY